MLRNRIYGAITFIIQLESDEFLKVLGTNNNVSKQAHPKIRLRKRSHTIGQRELKSLDENMILPTETMSSLLLVYGK